MFINLGGLPGKVLGIDNKLASDLDVKVSSRSSSSEVAKAADWTPTRATKIDTIESTTSAKLDKKISDVHDVPFFRKSVKDYLPLIGDSTDFTIWSQGNTSARVNPESSYFWAEIARHGAYVSGLSTGGWRTVVDVNGSGFFAGAISHEFLVNSTYQTAKLEITIDGVVNTINVQYANTGVLPTHRVFIGALSSVGTDLNYGANFNHYSMYTVYEQNSCKGVIITPEVLLNLGLPVLRFNSNLKVRVDVRYLGGSINDNYAGALYLLEKHWS